MAKLGRKREDLTGMRFGRLVALTPLAALRWLCQCDCGTVSQHRADDLKRGLARSCGCLRSEMQREAMEKINERRYA